MPSTTRQRILEYLVRNRSASARELAGAMRMTPANARRHLGILLGDGRVKVVLQRQIGRGRPEKLYRPAGTLVGDNLSELADAILSEAGTKVRMDALARRLVGDSRFGDLPLARRLLKVVEFLNERGYQARWEAGPQGPQIILGNCPYGAVIADHPGLCRMDAHMLRKLLGGKLAQVAKLEPGASGVPYCLFRTVPGD